MPHSTDQNRTDDKNDEAALRAFLVAHQKPLLAVLRRLLKNEDDAEDALADGIFRVWRARQSYRGECSWKNWVFRIVRNTGLDVLEKRASHSAGRVVWGDAQNEIEDTAAPHSSPAGLADVLVGREQAAQVRVALGKLPEEFRIAVALHYLENKSYKEIEEITGVPQTTLKPRLSRALKMLRRELAGLMEEENREPAPRRPRQAIL